MILFCFLLAWLLVWSFVPLVRRFGVVDYPNHRKIHKEPIPCSGGIAIYLGFFGSVLLTLSISPDLSKGIWERVIRLSFPGALLLLLGIYDDKKDISPHLKLLGQITIVLIAISLGFRIDKLTNPFGGVFQLGFFSIPITIFWFLGLINAMNLIDGLDGLSTGITSIAGLTLLCASIVSGDMDFSILMAGLAGATSSFLRFNLSGKRRIFLGDNGSMLLGFLLGATAIIGSYKGAVFSVLLATVLCLGVPIYDTGSAILRRLKKNIPIFSADNEHIHHQLLTNGFTKRGVILTLYLVTFILGLIGLSIVLFHDIPTVTIILGSGSLVLLIKRRWWLAKLGGSWGLFISKER